MNLKKTPFSKSLEGKIQTLAKRRTPIKLGELEFDSPLLLAPMSAICHAPFRLLMEQLGAGGTVSELISCHGIAHRNDRTKRMLYVSPDEKNIGIQLFGEDANAMAEAAKFSQDYNPKFIDINMGCPVRKVVSKGGGSALLKDTTKLGQFFKGMKDAIDLPLTIKIRTGWDSESINALEVIKIAKEEGVEFVAIHGRTRTQQYQGKADWQLLESIAKDAPLPIIGNGDLHTPEATRARMNQTGCDALMIARGALRNPFLFLESYLTPEDDISFSPSDYMEVVGKYRDYMEGYVHKERVLHVQLKKIIVWFATGFPNVAKFRGKIFETSDFREVLKITEDYFISLEASGLMNKKIDHSRPFMMGGHG